MDRRMMNMHHPNMRQHRDERYYRHPHGMEDRGGISYHFIFYF